VQAGLWALRQGGNAIDAAVASTLMAGVAEPLLTGLGGAGVATVRFGGQVHTVDFFSNMPGLACPDADQAAMEEVSIDYGPTTQSFLVGKGAAGLPGVPSGLWALADTYGLLPMSELVKPAIKAAVEGVEVTEGFAKVCALLWPILNRSPDLAKLFSPHGHPLRQGELFFCPDLAATLADLGQNRACFSSGQGAQAFVDHLGDSSLIRLEDLAAQQPAIRPSISIEYRGAKLWVPGVPSAAGLGVAHTLSALELAGSPASATGIDMIERLERALGSTVAVRGKAFLRDLFTEGFGPSFIARVQSMRDPTAGISPGYTTHISTVDHDGNAVSITHSLGETSGELAGSSGVIINNFLGEADVNPPFLRRPAGGRLVTMCCPSILEMPDGRIIALGSGGSSRIPTAIIHGTMYIVDQQWSVQEAVRGPRTHVEAGRLHVESDGRSDQTMLALERAYPDVIRFDGPNLFFGGLHAVSGGPDGFSGEGDSRRSGEYGET
jgi:gamma-glutamyltranspeptidase/glutathione hydrolase